MRHPTPRLSRRWFGFALGVMAIIGLAPATSQAQYSAPELRTEAIGEKYHVELAGTLWTPSLFGVISSEQFGIAGDEIDFQSDLGFKRTRFKDLRIVLRPGQKHRFRIQYTPVLYTAETTLNRSVVFNGQLYPVSLPIQSTFGWKVWRVGYEYDFYYSPRGFVGVLVEARFTELTAELRSLIADESTLAKGPLPAIGGVGRVYILPEVAINFELSGFKVPDVDQDYKANYFDWDIHGTFNVNNYVGLQVGWRRMTTFLNIENDIGDTKFQGMWFGGVVRY
ncbi:MAG TPA: hypothetical protein VES67_07600 [Vicinamibacterales bacterium]|nr:hypothetical protein [Vicinamibacterales bacterium]